MLYQVALIINAIAMPAWVSIPYRIIQCIRVPIQTLRVARVGHNRISLNESTQQGVVISAVVKVQANGSIFALSCKTIAGGGCAGGVAVCALFQRKDAEARGSVFSSAVTRCSGGGKIGPEFHSVPRAHDARECGGVGVGYAVGKVQGVGSGIGDGEIVAGWGRGSKTASVAVRPLILQKEFYTT